MKTALVLGATGLVGEILIHQLSQNNQYSKVIILARREVNYPDPKIQSVLFDFDNPNESLVQADHIYCAIGTTLKKAGSKENQYKIDCEYPAKIASIAKKNGAKKFILVSSIGADAKSSNFYLRTKGQLEEKLSALNFEELIIMRPSFILGKRKEFRLGEKIGIVMAKALRPLMVGPLRKYAGVNAESIAQKMISTALVTNQKKTVIESDRI